MVYVIGDILQLVAYQSPPVFYVFVLMMAVGVAVMFLENRNAGLIAMVLASLFFFYSDFFLPFSYILAVIGAVMLALYNIGFEVVYRKLLNSINWFYIYYRLKRHKSPDTNILGTLNKKVK